MAKHEIGVRPANEPGMGKYVLVEVGKVSKSQRKKSLRGEQDRPSVLSQALGPCRLPTPSAVECARLMDCVGSDPELARVLAVLMQRACVDPELWTSLQQLASVED